MTTGATSLLGLALPVQGELSGTWGDTVNNSITSLIDSAIAGTTTLSTDDDVTLTTTTLAANQSRSAIIRWTANNSVTRYITVPSNTSKIYIVINDGTPGYAGPIVIRGSGPTTGVTIQFASSAVVAWVGSDFKIIGGFWGVPVNSVYPTSSYSVLPSDYGTQIQTIAGGNIYLQAASVRGAQVTLIGPASGNAYIQTVGSASIYKAGSASTTGNVTLNPNAVVRCLNVDSSSGYAKWIVEGTGIV
jgi:hypothetical protein